MKIEQEYLSRGLQSPVGLADSWRRPDRLHQLILFCFLLVVFDFDNKPCKALEGVVSRGEEGSLLERAKNLMESRHLLAKTAQ